MKQQKCIDEIKTYLLQNHATYFHETWHKAEIQVCSNEKANPFQRGENNEIGKVH